MPVTITNGYCTLAQLKLEKGIGDTVDDDVLSTAINAASRQIDGLCGQRFWQDATATAYEFEPESAVCVRLDDPRYQLAGISTLTGLVVKVDIDLDGTFESTLTINTDFQPKPRNALLMVPARPYTELEIVPVGSQAFFPRAMYGRVSVQVTAKMGWPAVPDDITKACLIQAQMLADANKAAFGTAPLVNIDGGGMRAQAWNPLALSLVDPYRRPALG